MLAATLRPRRTPFAFASYRSRLDRNLTLAWQRLTVAATVAVSSVALACPACGRASEQTSGAYVAMTVVMSLLPLSAIGGVVYWVARQMRG